MRRGLMLLAFVAAWLSGTHDCRAEATRPNFLVILCDDLGYGDLGCFGHPTIKTPALDKLASQGVRFTSCYSAAPVCSPSRAGLMTGRVPSRMGIYDWISAGNVAHLQREQLTIPKLLKQAGYATCHVGKWHLNGKFNSPEQPQPGDHGFDHWMSTQNNAGPSHRNPKNFVRNGEPVGATSGFSCQVVADEAIAWLQRQPAEQPFFQFVCFHEPHEPVDSPEELVAQYPQATKTGEALYYANVSNMDRAVRRLLAALDELRKDDNTLVLFTSDNGPETLNRYKGAERSHGSPGPLRGMKLHLYEAGFRVPGIIRWPKQVARGQVWDEPICSLDLLPTFCELAGVAVPRDRVIDGTSLVPLLSGKPFHREKPLFWHYFRAIGQPKAAMRVGDWMLLGHWDGPMLPGGAGIRPGDSELIKQAKLTNFELYHMRTDLGQKQDVAAQHPDRVRELSTLMQARYTEVLREAPVWVTP